MARPAGRTVPVALAIAAAVALLATAAAADLTGAGSSPAPVVLRANPNVGPFQGFGAWVDLYDQTAWAAPGRTVRAMAADGVRTLYLETSNFNRGRAIVFPEQTQAFVDAAHRLGISIVAWYLPGLGRLSPDLRRARAAIQFTTANGNGFTGFALDIEAAIVRDPATRTARLLALSSEIRALAGELYPLGAIIPLPQRLQSDRVYWPDFPYAQLAATYDSILPMTYFAFRVSGCAAHDFTAAAISIIRRQVGSDQVPIHVIGGIAQEATIKETSCFVNAVREYGIIGASYYTFPGISDAQLPHLDAIPANPVGTPALPLRPGPDAFGNITGGDTTHPHEVVYRVGGKPGRWTLGFDAFDVQADEITVYVNWHLVATLDPGPDGDWTAPLAIPISANHLHDTSPNVIAFVASGDAPVWGVRNLSLTAA